MAWLGLAPFLPWSLNFDIEDRNLHNVKFLRITDSFYPVWIRDCRFEQERTEVSNYDALDR